MNEDMERKLNQIKDLLGKDNKTDGIKNIINLFGKQNQEQEQSNGQSRESGMPFDSQTIEMFLKIKQILDSSRRSDDPREKLLVALKPYLSEQRQDKIGEALTILKFVNIVETMTKLEGSENNAKP